MPGQLNIFDALASLDPTVVAVMEPEPGWVWTRCPVCQAFRYLRRREVGSRCILTKNCAGEAQAYLEPFCRTCGKAVTRARVGKNTDFCSKKCEGAK